MNVKDRVKTVKQKLDGWKAAGADHWETLKAAMDAAAHELYLRIDRISKKD